MKIVSFSFKMTIKTAESAQKIRLAMLAETQLFFFLPDIDKEKGFVSLE